MSKEETIIEYGPADVRERSSSVVVWLLLGVLLLSWAGIGAAGYYFWYLPRPDAQRTAEVPNDVRLAELEQKLQEMQRLMAEEKPGDEIADVEQKVGGLESRISTLEASELAQKKEVHSTAVIALLAVQDRVVSGEPYAIEMEALTMLLEKDAAAKPALEALDTNSEAGVRTLEWLRGAYPQTARNVMQAEYQDADTVGARIKRSLSKLIVIRKVDGTGSERDNALAGAEAALKTADLAAALESLSVLKGKEQEAASSWMEAARMTVHAQEAIKTLSARLRDQIVAGDLPLKEEAPSEVVLPETMVQEPKEAAPTPNKKDTKPSAKKDPV